MVQSITLEINNIDIIREVENTPSIFNGLEVVEGNPSIPMVDESVMGGVIILILAKGIFIHNAIIVQWDEERRRYP